MSENDVEYWKHKYALLEEQFLLVNVLVLRKVYFSLIFDGNI